ncbi:hypothetical protein [Planomonospora sp. ID67723]|uniref:hypothetical protein n=1 Tax=Planomonospora sp. ID67723 TaxID=2738134 RepID=UPI0018C3D1A9|nr:hypothetical protein [Planomonospora sp. ID67723]
MDGVKLAGFLIDAGAVNSPTLLEIGRQGAHTDHAANPISVQAAFMNGSVKGWAAYKVADSVNVHEGWGMGSYCVFTSDPTIEVDRGFEAPVKPGVKFHSLLAVSLGGKGRYNHVVNDTGDPAYGVETIPSTVTSYP